MSARKRVRSARHGAALIVSMIFILVFSALAISIATMSGTNVQVAVNHHKANSARACAESGLEIIRLWITHVSIPGATPQDERFGAIANSFQSATSGISNVTPVFDGSAISIPSVTMDSAEGRSFCAVITQIDADTLQLAVAGTYGSITRTVRVNYTFGTRAHNAFNYGIATKGPLHLTGNIGINGANISLESDAYIESLNSPLALSITGNSQIAGDVNIVNPLATVDLKGGQAGIGGEKGQAAIDNHVTFGAPPTEFPEPDPALFEPYTVNVVDATTDTSADATFENIRIAAGTNPTFSGHVTLKGVVFVETPNVVKFTGTTDITGIIVADGDPADNSGTNQLIFQGDVGSSPVTELPDAEPFTEIRDKTGTFVIAPGFRVSFGGSFSTLNGAIAGNGIEFFGNAGGTVKGSILNYSDEQMALTGNSDIYFNRSGTAKVPAGFIPEIILQYDPTSYREVAL